MTRAPAFPPTRRALRCIAAGLMGCLLPLAAQETPAPALRGDIPELLLEPAPASPEAPAAPAAPSLPRTRSATAPRPGEPERVRMTDRSPIEESSVRGGQFHVWGRERRQRGVLLTAAGETQRLVLNALRQPLAFRHPIVVQIRDAGTIRSGSPQVWSDLAQVPGGFRFEVNVVPVRGVVPGDIWRQEIVRCLLAEMILRDRADADLSGREAPPPDWLLHGTLELLEYQALGRPSAAFAAVFKLGHVLPLDAIFQADPDGMDSVSRSIYRASCCGLLLMLMEQPRGADGITALLPALAAGDSDPSTAIARAFPALTASGNSLSKWWALQLASMAQPSADEILSPRDTEAALVDALVLHLSPDPPAAATTPARGFARLRRIFSRQPQPTAAPDTAETAAPAAPPASTLPFSAWQQVVSRKDRAAVFDRTALALTKLSVRAHPLQRPVIADYLVLVRDLADGKRLKEAPARLQRLEATRAAIRADMDRIEDYLDWYEATQQEQPGDAFRDYFRAEDELRRPPPPRPDRISRYLDAMEREFSE